MRELFISQHTFRNHLSHIRKKLDAHSIRDVVRIHQAMQTHTVSTLRLSPRGKEVFLLLMEGFTRPQIAERLGMSVNGVRQHRENMLRQNGCKSTLELIAKYHGTGGAESSENAPHE